MKKDRSCNSLIRDIYMEWTKCSNRFQTEYGISQAQLVYLKCLESAGAAGLYLKEIERRLQIGQASVVRMIDRLESMGMVEKLQDELDSRKKKARLTDNGKDCCSRAASIWENTEGEFTKTLTPDELEILKNLLLKVYENSVAVSESFQ